MFKFLFLFEDLIDLHTHFLSCTATVHYRQKNVPQSKICINASVYQLIQYLTASRRIKLKGSIAKWFYLFLYSISLRTPFLSLGDLLSAIPTGVHTGQGTRVKGFCLFLYLIAF